MQYRECLQMEPICPSGAGVWIRYAVENLEAVAVFLRGSAKHRTSSVAHAGAMLGALFAYSRPFTECPDPALNPLPEQRVCFLDLAADLGADLRLHATLLQVRDEGIALSDFVPIVSSWRPHAGRFNARRFKYPDSRFARVIGTLDCAAFQQITASMRLACDFFRVEIESRWL
jgi:hypothetical protein